MSARRYEPSDIHPRKIVWTAAALIGAIGLVHAIAYVLVVWFHGAAGPGVLVGNSVPRLPAELRGYLHSPAAALRARQERTLARYAWVDRAHGVVRIPIERAISLYLETHRGERLGRGSARVRCRVPTDTPDAAGCDLVFLPSVLPPQGSGSVRATEVPQ